jgi:hypothetical protein
MNPAETYFQDLTLSSHAKQTRATYEVVTPCALVRHMGQARARLPTWCHISLSRADCCGVTDVPSHRTMMESRHVSQRDS